MSPALLWSVLFWLWIALEVYVALLTRTRRGQGNTADRGTQLLLWLTIALAMTAGGFLEAMHLAPIALPAATLKLCSLLLIAAGLLLRIAAIRTLGKAFSANVAIRNSQQIKRDGLYRWMRHPSYTGMLLIFFACGLHRNDWLALAVALLPTTAVLLYRIHVEESTLRSAFGTAYDDYARSTRRLIPFVY